MLMKDRGATASNPTHARGHGCAWARTYRVSLHGRTGQPAAQGGEVRRSGLRAGAGTPAEDRR